MKNNGTDVKNITCATSNGAVFLETKNEFLDNEQKIVKDTTLEQYIKIKKYIREMYISKITKEKIVKGDTESFINRSIKSSGDMSLRFVFDSFEVEEEKQMVLALKEILQKTDLAEELYVFKGKHKNKLIWELSLADKIKAVKYFEEKYGIIDKNVVKLGDQGRINGNDFNMLNSYAGFSVDEIETSTANVLPIIDQSGNIIKGVDGTKRILRDLNLNKER